MAREWLVGELFLGFERNGLPVFTQPGGIGTTVYPQAPTQFPQKFMGYQQVPMSYPSLYVALCGHQFNSFEIFEVFQPSLNDQAALICCPICSLIQQILLYSEYQNYLDVPLVTA